MPVDGFGRKIEYLRLSVTDRCNFRCSYCLPVVYGRFRPSEELLGDEEIVRLAGAFAAAGFRRIRITGGEPLVRPGLPALVSRLAALPGIEDLSMTTNGMFLEEHAEALAEAGLSRVNVSVDTLDPERFREVTRYGSLGKVLAGLEAAIAAGLSPVKVNCVVARGVNGDEIRAFADLTETRDLHVRFIELMPMGATGFFNGQRHMPLDEMMRAAGALVPAGEGERPEGGGPARYWRRPGARGTVGFISALSCGFCDACNRVRLSATGTLVPCLDGDDGVDLRTPLRSGVSDAEILNLIESAIRDKPERHRMVERAEGGTENSRFMCQIGG